ncbi:MAG TPA: sigma-54 dependent transcriptional regulator [Thermoanaerobaculia bacterium]|nr:sigma-54 dependent transcriptional regulator [Thermoanaerobaculia bacterium]
MTRLLIVEDDEKIRAGLLFQLRNEGLAPQSVTTAEEAWALLVESPGPAPDLLLLDVRLPGISGVELVRRLAACDRLPPTVIVSGEASISETVEAVRLGVHDFIEKPFSRERLLQSIRNALETATLKRRVAALESRLEPEPEILGDSPPMHRLREAIAKAAATDARVLILGQSGTGKELVANALHRRSARRDAPFVKINCAAIPPHLIEGELFGHARGAFTDAKTAKAGLFEEAHRGTLFLDEIGDMDLTLQARLLRVLEDGRVRRLGETRDRGFDVRVLAATNRNLEAEVAGGRFREDLYFRLAHLPIEVPSLGEHREDLPLLLAHYLDTFAARHRVRRKTLGEGILPVLLRYPWPGNVRELRNLCERLTILGSDPITPDQLPSPFFEPTAPHHETGLLRPQELQAITPWKEFKAASEREYLEAVLRRTGWNFAAAARLLDLQRTYLHQKATSLGIARPRIGGKDEPG